MGPTEEELREQGYPDCQEWSGSLGIVEEAECIYEGELVKYWDTPYGADLQRMKDYGDLVDN